jgi:uncharacterized membrane protein YdbT with pleckstrin-like domain
MSDDFFGGRHNKQHDGSYQKDRHHQKEDNNNDHQSHKHEDIGQQIVTMLKANKKLLIAAIIGGVLILGVAVYILISLLPMITPILDNISKNGLKGAIDSVLPIINKLLSGTGK